jgi:ABC-type arginine transport system ATPase subunit
VLATHDLDVAEGLLSRAIYLTEGRMVGTETDSHGLLDRYRRAIQ